MNKDARMRGFINAHDWIAASHLPPCAPDLNPVEGIWSLYDAATRPTPPSRTPSTSYAHYVTGSGNSDTAATSSTDALPKPDPN
ncbi:hypothetical protein T261_8102 [Streptomyces lydicus]|nr:hypothetical protein T261_8102 [Streptomyces lydicus]